MTDAPRWRRRGSAPVVVDVLARVPRCRATVGIGSRRCARPIDHATHCASEPQASDRVRSVGYEHVLVVVSGVGDGSTAAGERGLEGGDLRARRDLSGRGLWFSAAVGAGRRRAGAPVLVGWSEIRRFAVDLNLELAERRSSTAPVIAAVRSTDERPPSRRRRPARSIPRPPDKRGRRPAVGDGRV